jgi:hypothetical protein
MTEDVSVHDVPSAASRPTAVAPTPASAGRSEAAAPEPAPDVETAGISQVDKKARDWVHLIVQDREGSPVANADIRMVGLRTKQDRGAHYAWPDEPSIGRTAKDGTARLWFPLWVTPDDEAGELTFKVSHPDFVTRIVDSFEIGPEPRVVVMDRGAFVVVSGWIDSPSEVIVDVTPHLTWDVRLEPDAWQPIRDGRLSTANIQPGEHGIYLSYSNPARGTLFSRIERFTLEKEEQKHLHLQLLPATKLEGVLEGEVPRPVVNGRVLLNLQAHWPGAGQAKMLRLYPGSIREDGTFTIEGLPPGDGQIIALCDGWASQRVRDQGWEDSAVETPERGERAWNAQRVRPDPERRFVLLMEPTANLKVVLRGPDGEPVRGATVSCWPNVFWLSGFANIFLDGTWNVAAGPNGEALVSNLPWGTLFFGVEHSDLQAPSVDGDRNRNIPLRPGETAEITVDLERKDP